MRMIQLTTLFYDFISTHLVLKFKPHTDPVTDINWANSAVQNPTLEMSWPSSSKYSGKTFITPCSPTVIKQA